MMNFLWLELINDSFIYYITLIGGRRGVSDFVTFIL